MCKKEEVIKERENWDNQKQLWRDLSDEKILNEQVKNLKRNFNDLQ